MPGRPEQIQRFVVTAQQMTKIESRVFEAGMPVAALMEKVAGLVFRCIQDRYPQLQKVGVLIGPGHNGGDAAVVAREFHLAGYEVVLCQPLDKARELTQAHVQYAQSLGMPLVREAEDLQDCSVIIDGLFGFGLTRPLEGKLADLVEQLNQGTAPILSIDLPSGIHTDTGTVLGTAIRASHTFCLGLWKRAFLQDAAVDYLGTVEMVDFGLPLADVQAVLGQESLIQRITPEMAIAPLPLPRPANTHKYRQGHLLLVCGSLQYTGATLLTGLAARASGVGMLSIAVPESLKLFVSSHIPDALVVGCPETARGAIAQLPDSLDLSRFDAIACGPGLTLDAVLVVQQLLGSNCPLVLDADGLNILASEHWVSGLADRSADTLLTPHSGEFRRLFPELAEAMHDRITTVQQASHQCGATVLLKGARVAIAQPDGQVWLNPDSTPALARGGSGDVLTGLVGGLLAQPTQSGDPAKRIGQLASTATWWHAQAALLAASDRTELGVDATTLCQYLLPFPTLGGLATDARAGSLT
jgi:NAD(P)H-hydrate epimerase